MTKNIPKVLYNSKFTGDFKSLANEADASLAKHKALELEIERLLKAVVSQDIMIIVQNEYVVDTSDLQTELERMFRINPSTTSRDEKHVPNTVSASARTKPIIVSQTPVITKKYENSKLNGLSSTGVDNTQTRRPQPRSNTKHDRVPSASKSSRSKNKEAEVKENQEKDKIGSKPDKNEKQPIDSLSMGDEHHDIIPATESDEVIKSSVEDLVPIPTLKDNPTQSSDCKTKSSSTSLNSFLEDTSTFHNSLPEFENFYFDLGEISSGSTTTHSNISLPDYETFYFDNYHVKEISSGSPTTQTDISRFEYDSFIFEEFQYLDELKRLSNLEYRDEIKIAELTEKHNGMSIMDRKKEEHLQQEQRNLEYHDEIKIVELTKIFNGMSIEIQIKEKLLQQEQWAYLSTHPSKRLTSFCYDDDDDYNSAITPVLSTEEPVNFLSMGDEHLDTISATESDEVIKFSVEDLIPIPSESEGIPEHMCGVPFHDNSPPLDVSNDQIEDFSKSNNEVSLIDDDSFSIDKIDYVEASPPDSELVSSEVMEIVISEVGGIDDDIPLTIKDDNLREKCLNVNLLIATIEALNDNPTPSFDCKTKSSSTSLNSLLEETNTFHNSLPEFENFYFDLGEISSGSTTTLSDISLPDYEAFYFDDDHIKEISSGSTTTHSDISLSEYDSFIFDLTHEEFVDELAHIISPPEYDRFYF
nr:hypothetical protein [Tanacetum cinerariifolium]